MFKTPRYKIYQIQPDGNIDRVYPWALRIIGFKADYTSLDSICQMIKDFTWTIKDKREWFVVDTMFGNIVNMQQRRYYE